MGNFRQRVALLTIGLAATSAVGAAFALAHGGDASQVHGCVGDGSKLVRIVDANENCRSNETALDWAIQGPPGPPGTGVAQIGPVRVAGNQSEVLLTAGPLTLTGVCWIDLAFINVSTTQDNTVVAGIAAIGIPGREIDPGQTASVIAVGALRFATNSFYVLAPDGTSLGGQLAAGVNLTDQVDSCVFTGYVVTG